MPTTYTIDSPEVAEILAGVYRCSPQSYFKVSAEGKCYTYPVRRHLMELGLNQKAATRILQSADIPHAEFIRNEVQPPAEPEPDPQAMILAAMEAAAKEAERQEKRAKAAREEEAAIRKKHYLVRQGSYHGVYSEDSGTQVLFHTIDEAREYLQEVVSNNDRAAFRQFFGGSHYQGKN